MRKGEHLASICDFRTLIAHTYTPAVSDGQYHVMDCWHNPHKQFFQPKRTYMHRCLHTHTAFTSGLLSKSSFPKVLIMSSAQYGKSISRPWQKWRASFPPFPFISSSNTEMHPANSHSYIWEPICQHFYFDTACYLESLHPITLISSLLLGAKQSEWQLIRLTHIICPPFSRCNSLGAYDLWDQTVWWDSS